MAYVKNRQNTNINLTTFAGYSFVIPPGVSWLWDDAANHLLTNIFKIEATPGKDKYGLDNGHGLPPLLSAKEEDWDKEGKKLCQVSRYQIKGKMIPRKKLITIAQERGVSNARILEYLADPQIDQAAIAADINALPVPEEICRPKDNV